MKKCLIAFGIMVLCFTLVYSAPPVMETPVLGFGTPTTIAISSTTNTMVPSSQTSGRVGVFISNPSNSIPLPIIGYYGNCTSNSVATTIRPIEIATSSTTTNNRYFSMREDVCLWLLATDTVHATTSIHYQEVKQ